MIWVIIVAPLDLYYEDTAHPTPPALERIYKYPFFDWRVTTVIVLAAVILFMGAFLIWVGWYEMHPVKINPKKIKNNNINRLKLVKTFNKEQFLENLRKEAHEYAMKRKKK